MNLYKVNQNSEIIIARVPKIALLKSLGICFGTRVKLLNRFPLGGAVVLRVEDAYTVALGKAVAELIEVEG